MQTRLRILGLYMVQPGLNVGTASEGSGLRTPFVKFGVMELNWLEIEMWLRTRIHILIWGRLCNFVYYN
jgi:hypothetical protein